MDESFATTPNLTTKDYIIVRSLSKWTSGQTSCDFSYLICKDKAGNIVSAKEVNGNPKATFTVWIPQSILYTTSKKMTKTEINISQTKSWAVQNSITIGSDNLVVIR